MEQEQKIVDFFKAARDRPGSAVSDPDLARAIANRNEPVLPVFVVGAGGVGKSTLINALLHNKWMPCGRRGSTTTLTELRDTQNGEERDCCKVVEADAERIVLRGHIPFARAGHTPLMLVDTPGLDGTLCSDCRDAIYRALGRHSPALVLYVMSCRGRSSYGAEPESLAFIANQMEKGQDGRSKYLFVLNGMDALYPDEENVGEVLSAVKNYLAAHGIPDPQIIPCAARTALNLRLYLKNVNVQALTMAQARQLPTAARETLLDMDKLNDYPAMHLEQYAACPPALQSTLNEKLRQAKRKAYIKEQALIHSGVGCLEGLIAAYEISAEKKKTADLVGAFDAYNKAFVEKEPCRVLVTATMSAGKSTFINALIGENVCLSRNMACTSKIHSIVSKPFDADFTFESDYALSLAANQEKDEALADKVVVRTVYFGGLLGGQRLVINDSPGVNYSGDAEHKQITDRMITAGKYQLLIYLMNATQLGTNDEEAHLAFVREHIGEKPILFVINKADAFNEEEEDIEAAVGRQVRYLEAKGFHEPLVCPVSARAGLLAKRSRTEPLNRIERRELNCMEDKFEEMKLVEYYGKYFPDIVVADSEEEDRQVEKTCGIGYVEMMIKTICEGGHIHGTAVCEV